MDYVPEIVWRKGKVIRREVLTETVKSMNYTVGWRNTTALLDLPLISRVTYVLMDMYYLKDENVYTIDDESIYVPNGTILIGVHGITEEDKYPYSIDGVLIYIKLVNKMKF